MNSWNKVLESQYIQLSEELFSKASREREAGKEIFPEQNNIFRALELTPPDKVKICLIGQDPYHTPGMANGLAFSVNPDCKLPPSLRNIFKELHDDIGCEEPKSGDLSKWAEQGVLLLNTSLTVEAHSPASHKDWGWNKFTGHVFETCLHLSQPIVFMLWGLHAQQLAFGVNWHDYDNKTVIKSAHPSSFSANRGFFGSRPFSRANEYLISKGSAPVDWSVLF